MKRILLLFACSLVMLSSWAQFSEYKPSFSATDASGSKYYYYITDATQRHVRLLLAAHYQENGNYHRMASEIYPVNNKVVLPAQVEHGGQTYQVKGITGALEYANTYPRIYFNADTLVIPEGVEEIGPDEQSFIWFGRKVTYLPTTLKYIGKYGFGENWGVVQFIGFENCQLVRIGDMAFNQCGQLTNEWRFPETLRYLGANAVELNANQRYLELPAALDTMHFQWIYNIRQTYYPSADYLRVIRLKNPVPPVLPDSATATQTYAFTPGGQKYLNWNMGLFSFHDLKTHWDSEQRITVVDSETFLHPDTIYTPVDATAAYKSRMGWDIYDEQYYEELSFTANGYTTYYLENENFQVPTGCTAYIITGIVGTPSSSQPADAIVRAFGPGSLIPKQTGFILEGTPGAKQTYRAHVAGTEADVTGNLLVGTATEREFSEAGYKYYVFGKGKHGQGFYFQGSRFGQSIRLAPHKAGLRLPQGAAPVKGLRIDFQAAREQLLTGITPPAEDTAKSASPAVYDLTGRRLSSQPRRKGIYIVDGKKTLVP